MDQRTDEGARNRRWYLGLACVVLFSFALRCLYVASATTAYPIRGDINQFVLYAWNLDHRGIYSSAPPDVSGPEPDSYREPGYPAFLALTMALAGHADLPVRPGSGGRGALGYETDTWMRIALGLQAVLGALTVWLVIAVGRLWLPPGAALGAGVATAIWPHMVTFTGVLLSETLFAFSLALSFWLLCNAQASGRKTTMAVAGAAWGLTYLVNPIVAIFPLLASVLIARRSGKTLAVVFVAAFVLAPAFWAVRSASMSTATRPLQRVAENFVQGSWPQFLAAFNSQSSDDMSRQIVAAVNEETNELATSPAAGLQQIGARMAQDPPYYLDWYLFGKPWLLWDWSIRVGTGDIYFLPVEYSPFERIPVLSAANTLLRTANPAIFLLAAAACMSILLANLGRRTRTRFAPLAVSLLAMYLTGVHVVLQAEPRYSIPYRPEELLLAATAVAWLVERLRRRYRKPASISAESARSSPAALRLLPT